MNFGIFPGIARGGRRRRSSPISALVQPSLGPLASGDAIGPALSSGIGAAANYTSTAGSISGVTVAITVDGAPALATDTVAFGDLVMVVVEVSDSAGNTRIWIRQRMTAGLAPVFIAGPNTSLSGRLVTFSLGVASGVPAPDLAVTSLSLNGADVLGELAGLTYTVPDSETASVVAWTVTATNALGSVAVSGSVEVAASQDPWGPGPLPTWTLLGAAYVGQSPALATGGDMRTVEFSADGNRAYAVFRSTQVVRQYDLASPYDITSAVAGGNGSHDFSGYITTGTRGDSVAHGLFIRKDTGTTAWLWNRTEVWVLTLSTPWDITTASQTGYFFFGSGNPTGVSMSRGHDLDWKADGTRWFVEDRSNGRVYQWDCTTPWDITTSVAVGSYVIPSVDEVRGIELQPDGARMFLMHTTAMEAREYHLSTPWDVTTASLVRSFSVAGQSADPRSITYRPNGASFFVGDASSRRVHVYDFAPLPPPPDPTRPTPFTTGMWSVNADGEVTFSSLPDDGGSAITDLQYRVDAGSGFGSAVSFGASTINTYPTTAEEGDSVQVRAVNAVDADPDNWSDIKTVPGVAPSVVADDFTGRTADVLLGADPAWTLLHSIGGGASLTLRHVAAELRRESGSDEAGWYRIDASAGLAANQYARVTIAAATSTTQASGSALCRIVNAENYYEARYVRYEGSNNLVNEVRLIRRAGGVETVLSTAGFTYSVPVDLRIEANGTAIRVLLGGAEVIAPVTDSTHTSGSAGLGARRSGGSGSSVRITSFECGTL